MRVLILLAAALVLAACGKLTEANYAKLKSGMTIDEVEAVMGSADKCDEALGFRSCEWGSEQKYIRVKYMGGKVIALSKRGLE
jgi:hypothetical protein